MAKIDERYKRGQIYTIRCKYDDDMIYVGSTINTLAKRMGDHRKTSVKRATSLYHVVQGDWDNWYIELHENYSCNNKQELLKREGQVIREIGTINRYVAGRTRKEYLEENKDNITEKKKLYYQNNRDKMLEQKKEYYLDSRDKILEKNKERYHDNREKNIEKMKEYRQKNHDELLEKMLEKINCNICGCETSKCHLKRHQRSKKCMNYNLNNK